MQRLFGILLFFTALLAAQSIPVVFTNVTVIDATGGPALPNRTVVIADGRIHSIDAAANEKTPPGAVVVDGAGKFLIPGLWDMHIHLRGGSGLIPDNEASLSLYLANGITGVREMGGDIPETVYRWRAEIANGERLGPRIVTAGPKIDGPKPAWPGSIPVTTPEEARAAVRKVKAMGSDFVKTYSFTYPHEVFVALTDEARRQGLRIGGHLPLSEGVRGATDGGISFLEHLSTSVVAGCSPKEAEIEHDYLSSIDNPPRMTTTQTRYLFAESFDDARARDLIAHLAEKQVWITPTLAVEREVTTIGQTNYDNDPRRKFILAGLWKSWDPKEGRRHAISEEDQKHLDLIRERASVVLRMLEAGGVGVLAGSDSGASNNFTFPGWTLHRELAMMVEAGLTPMQALQAATRNPARYLGELDRAGTVETGKTANLVLLSANPLDDIRNTQKIDAVVARGKLLRRADLDRLLEDVAAKAARSRTD